MKKERIISIDLLRGLILILMAIDHVGYFICKNHPYEFWGLPLPQHQNGLAFLTRFITHICAPGFFFLMGIGIIIFSESRRSMGWSETKIARFFIKRGLILIFLQFMLENPAWFIGKISDRSGSLEQVVVPGGVEDVWFFFGVLFALGSAMIVWGLLIRFQSAFLFGLTISFILFSQFLIPSADKVTDLYSPLLRILIIPGRTGIMQVFYPVIPWLGLTGLGIILGRIIVRGGEKIYRLVFLSGIFAIMLFLILRILGGFGNLHTPTTFNLINFFNLTKYPPSLVFVLFTIGVCSLLMWVFSKSGKLFRNSRNPLLVFGRVSLFFYLSHLCLFALVGCAFPNGAGYSTLYLIWITGLLLLYPLCLLYNTFKRKKPPDSIWRFL